MLATGASSQTEHAVPLFHETYRTLFRRLHFDFWYLFRPPWDTGISPPELLAYIEGHRPGRAVDLGCGTGTNVLTLVRHGWQATGVDYSPRALRIARDKARRAGARATFIVADLSERLDIHGSFDLAIDIGCFHAVANRARYLTNLAAILGLEGHWLLYAFWEPSGTAHRVGIDEADLDYIASQGLRLVERKDGFDRPGRPSAWFLFQRSRILS